MSNAELVTVEILEPCVLSVVVEVLDRGSDPVEVNAASQPALVDVVIGGMPGPTGAPGSDGEDGVDGEDGSDGIGLTPRGDYDSSTAYEPNDLVRDQTASWVCLQATVGEAPPQLPAESNDYWQLVTKDGYEVSSFSLEIYAQNWATGTTNSVFAG